jgi:diadenosine tetraphosphate (Ap4A) HIT family hydrolase
LTADCLFCKKLADLEALPPHELLWQFPHSVALLGSWQYFLGYCVLISRRHATELSRLSDAERVAYLNEMCLLARAIEDCFRPRKMNYELLGNQVPHLHWHLFPRYEYDPEKQKPVWIPLDRAEGDAVQKQRLQTGPMSKEATAEALRSRLRQLIGKP